MLLDPTDAQATLRDATARYLADQAPPSALRQLRHSADGFEAGYWERGAGLGWTSLLVREEHGGGSVSGEGLIDLALLAHEFGARAAPGPLLPANIVAAALSSAWDPSRGDLLGRMLLGRAVGAWAYCEHLVPASEPGRLGLDIRPDGSDLVIRGVKRPVEAGAQADHLLVTGRSGDGLTQVLVPRSTAGLTVEPMRTTDLTRRFARLRFDDVRVPATHAVGEVGGAGADVERQLLTVMALSCAEAVGAMQSAFDMTVAWSFDRYTFGRPLASYQALKHRFADMKSWLEGAHAISDAAAAAVSAGDRRAGELVGAAKAFTGEYGTRLVQECVQLHGGIGVTFDHDLHLFLRRVTLHRATWGIPAEHLRHVTDLLDVGDVAA